MPSFPESREKQANWDQGGRSRACGQRQKAEWFTGDQTKQVSQRLAGSIPKKQSRNAGKSCMRRRITWQRRVGEDGVFIVTGGNDSQVSGVSLMKWAWRTGRSGK